MRVRFAIVPAHVFSGIVTFTISDSVSITCNLDELMEAACHVEVSFPEYDNANDGVNVSKSSVFPIFVILMLRLNTSPGATCSELPCPISISHLWSGLASIVMLA